MEKRKRSSAKGTFTRQETHLTELLDLKSPMVVVTPQYEKFLQCWNNLEEAHESFLAVEDIDAETHDDGDAYLVDPSKRYRTVVNRYAEYLKSSAETDRAEQKQVEESSRAVEEASRKQIEAEKKAAEAELQKQQQELNFASAKAELETSIEAFKRLAEGLKGSISQSSDSIKRRELEKVDAEFTSLKARLVTLAGVDHSKDIADVQEKFRTNVEKVYMDFHSGVTKDLKDVPAIASGGGDHSTSYKKEPLTLPEFAGEEKSSPSPFLTFPIWLKQWKSIIEDYPVKHRDRLLCQKLDATALTKVAGFENDYVEAMKHLEQYKLTNKKLV